MTKVEIPFELERPLDAAALDRIAAARRIYGILRIAPVAGGLMVEYDASRLTAADVEAVLRRAAIPVRDFPWDAGRESGAEPRAKQAESCSLKVALPR